MSWVYKQDYWFLQTSEVIWLYTLWYHCISFDKILLAVIYSACCIYPTCGKIMSNSMVSCFLTHGVVLFLVTTLWHSVYRTQPYMRSSKHHKLNIPHITTPRFNYTAVSTFRIAHNKCNSLTLLQKVIELQRPNVSIKYAQAVPQAKRQFCTNIRPTI